MPFPVFADRVKQEYGKSATAAADIYRAFFKSGEAGLERLPVQLSSSSWVAEIKAKLTAPPAIITHQKQAEGVTKFISRLKDDLEIETVLVPMGRYVTACISSQAGCRMGCRFCETGKLGLIRNLTTEEIVYQVYAARHQLSRSVKNIVFMGMGEPFDNFDNVLHAIGVLSDQRGLNIAERNITISTSGRIDGLRRLADLNRPHIRLAVSLNAPDDKTRSRIMPINRSAPMAELKKALLDYPLKPGFHFVIEYVLIQGLNDRPEQADTLARYLSNLPVKVNLIPCNPAPDAFFSPPAPEAIETFRLRLVANRIFVRMRATKGVSLMAACGQLGRGFSGTEPRTLVASAF